MSWLSSSVHEWSTDCQGTPARNARIVADGGVAVEPRQPDRHAPERRLQLVRQLVAAQPRPDGAQEAGVVHRPVPAAAARGRPGSRGRARRSAGRRAVRATPRTSRATSASRSAPRSRPVMFATSIRQPSRPGVEPAPRPTARHPRAQLGRAPVELRQRADAVPRLVAVRQRVVEVVESRSARSSCAARNHSCPTPMWFERQVAEHAEPARMRGARQRRERLVAAEQRVDPVEGASRRSDACCPPGRTASGRAGRRPAPRCGRAAPRSRARSPPYHSRASSGPRPVGSSSQSRRTAQSGALAVDAARAKRSGKIS